MKTTAIVLLALTAASAAGHADSRRFAGAVSGWSTPSDEVSAESSTGGVGFYTEMSGRDTFGKVSTATVGGVAAWDGATFCDFDDTGSPRGVLLDYVGVQQVWRRRNGDLVYLTQSSSPPSTLCFNFIDNASSTFEVHLDVTGGTGRFEGATGEVEVSGHGRSLGTITPLSAELRGTVNLTRPDDEDDD